jgi:hypothetical protein
MVTKLKASQTKTQAKRRNNWARGLGHGPIQSGFFLFLYLL